MQTVRCLCLLLAMAMCLSVCFAQGGYESFPTVPGSQYKLYLITHPWTEAQALCQGDGAGAHLVIINSQEEADVVKELFSRVTDSRITWLSVGINDIVQDGTWVTVQGNYFFLLQKVKRKKVYLKKLKQTLIKTPV